MFEDKISRDSQHDEVFRNRYGQLQGSRVLFLYRYTLRRWTIDRFGGLRRVRQIGCNGQRSWIRYGGQRLDFQLFSERQAHPLAVNADKEESVE